MQTGAQGVSLTDLMQLGMPQLNAMAQGQVQSIAPSYMVIAALKALTDAQSGQQMPMPLGTVRDQVLAMTAPRQAMGIGGLPARPTAPMMPAQATQRTMPSPGVMNQMAAGTVGGAMMPPVVGMAEGGAVRHFSRGGETDPNTYVPAYTPRSANDDGSSQSSSPIEDILAGIYRFANNNLNNGPVLNAEKNPLPSGDEMPNVPPIPIPDVTIAASAAPPSDAAGFNALPLAARMAILADAQKTGVNDFNYDVNGQSGSTDFATAIANGAMGGPSSTTPSSVGSDTPSATQVTGLNATPGADANPYARYNPINPQAYPSLPSVPTAADRAALAASYKMPVNQQLLDAASQFATPDQARLAEYAKAQQNAGLAAFASNILRGRGMGAAIGPAADAANQATQQAITNRQQYQDAREKIAADLAIKAGEEGRTDYTNQLGYGNTQANTQFSQGLESAQLGTTQTGQANTLQLELQRNQLQLQANQIANQIRQEGVDENNRRDFFGALDNAQRLIAAQADSLYGKIDPLLAGTPQFANTTLQKQNYINAEMSKFTAPLQDVIQSMTARMNSVPPSRGGIGGIASLRPSASAGSIGAPQPGTVPGQRGIYGQ